jgi:DNA-binding NarL/FixJ family response regulator
MDIQLPVLTAAEATRQICSDLRCVEVLIPATVARDEEICFISHVINKLSPSNGHHQSVDDRDGGERDKPVTAAFQELTAREREIVRLAALGLTNCEIAERLIVSPKTAKTHVSRAMTKLGVHHRAALAAIAYQSGLVDATATPTRDEADPDRRSQPNTRP